MRVTIGQTAVTDLKETNLEAFRSAVAEAAAAGSSLIVFPELSLWYKKGAADECLISAEEIPGPSSKAIDGLAKEFSIAIAVGLYEKLAGEERVFNTVYVASAEGIEIGRYRKLHLYDAFGLRESDTIAASRDDAPFVFDLGELRFGLMTCYDLRFPESARALVDAGANVIVLPALWMPGIRKEDHWTTLARARAIENTTYLIASNSAAPLSFGSSMVIDPMGVVVVQLPEGPGTRTVTIEASRIAEVRELNPSLANRRFRVVRT